LKRHEDVVVPYERDDPKGVRRLQGGGGGYDRDGQGRSKPQMAAWHSRNSTTWCGVAGYTISML
jgi:hypothetical protein